MYIFVIYPWLIHPFPCRRCRLLPTIYAAATYNRSLMAIWIHLVRRVMYVYHYMFVTVSKRLIKSRAICVLFCAAAERYRFWSCYFKNRVMARKGPKVLLGFEDEYVTEKHKSIVNFTTNKVGGRPVSNVI